MSNEEYQIEIDYENSFLSIRNVASITIPTNEIVKELAKGARSFIDFDTEKGVVEINTLYDCEDDLNLSSTSIELSSYIITYAENNEEIVKIAKMIARECEELINYVQTKK